MTFVLPQRAPSRPTNDLSTPPEKPSLRSRMRGPLRTTIIHITKHVGPGILASVAYFDPGNWGVDLQAGAQFGYKLLFVVLLAGLGAILLQLLACRLGCVTGLDLATHCRMMLYSRPKHKLWYRRALLYPLYCICEIGIIATDLAELIGGAIGICLLIPSIPLWAGVVITAADVFVVLAMGGTLGGRPVRLFELFIIALVLSVFVCFIILIHSIDPVWKDVFNGYVPSKTLFKPGALYTSIGILGATVMPHALFLGSSLATQDRISKSPLPTTFSFPFRFRSNSDPTRATDPQTPSIKTPVHEKKLAEEEPQPSEPTIQNRGVLGRIFYARRVSSPNAGRTSPEIQEIGPSSVEQPAVRSPTANSPVEPVPTGIVTGHESSASSKPAFWSTHKNHVNNNIDFIRGHLGHAIVDIVMSLLGFAVAINSAILILASAAFFYSGMDPNQEVGLFDAHALIRDRIGKPAAFLFALALLSSGQSASLTATLAGQVVSEGFIAWSVSPVLRRSITRLIGLIPAAIIAAVIGRAGIDALLVASQVVLSLVLPFVIFPLILLTSSEEVMKVKTIETNPDTGEQVEKVVSYKNHWFITGLSYLLWGVIVIANAYVLVTLAMGQGG